MIQVTQTQVPFLFEGKSSNFCVLKRGKFIGEVGDEEFGECELGYFKKFKLYLLPNRKYLFKENL